MRQQADEFKMWMPCKAAVMALASVLSPQQQQKFQRTVLALAKIREEATLRQPPSCTTSPAMSLLRRHLNQSQRLTPIFG
jgi:hypothetical protein